MEFRKFIEDSLSYYEHFYGTNISYYFARNRIKYNNDVFYFSSSLLNMNVLREIYNIGLEDYGVEVSFNEFIEYLCGTKEIRRRYYNFSRKKDHYKKSSFRQPKNNKVQKKESKKDKQILKEKRRNSKKKSWKRSYKKSSLKRGKRAYRNWIKNEINRYILDNNYEINYSISTGKDYNFADPWDWY